MNISYTLDDDDYLFFLVNLYSHPKTIWGYNKILAILFVLLLTWFGIRGGHAQNLQQIVIILLIDLSLIISLPIEILGVSITTIKRQLKEGRNEFSGFRSLNLDEKALVEIRPGGRLEVAYDQVTKIARSQDFIFIYLGVMKAIIVPLTAFKSGEDCVAFTKCLHSKTGQAIIKVKPPQRWSWNSNRRRRAVQ